tara:strand:- start:2424 stop:2909 length:486 start_codon:yes stop_codon:yes gene_type:complete
MTIGQFFSKLRILYFVFISSLIPIFFISLFYNDLILLDFGRSISTLIAYGVAFIGISTVGLSFLIFKFFTSKADEHSELTKKLTIYHQSYLLRSAIIEGMALLTAVTFALTHQQFLLIISALYIGLLIFIIPSKKEVKNVFKLSVTDQMKLDNNSHEITIP